MPRWAQAVGGLVIFGLIIMAIVVVQIDAREMKKRKR